MILQANTPCLRPRTQEPRLVRTSDIRMPVAETDYARGLIDSYAIPSLEPPEAHMAFSVSIDYLQFSDWGCFGSTNELDGGLAIALGIPQMVRSDHSQGERTCPSIVIPHQLPVSCL